VCAGVSARMVSGYSEGPSITVCSALQLPEGGLKKLRHRVWLHLGLQSHSASLCSCLREVTGSWDAGPGSTGGSNHILLHFVAAWGRPQAAGTQALAPLGAPITFCFTL